MSEITTDQVKEFRKQYNCLLNTSNHQYSKAIIRPLGISSRADYANEYPEIQVEPGLDITLMKEQFHQLVRDAELGREIFAVQSRHPTVLAAYEQYRMALMLTKQWNTQ